MSSNLTQDDLPAEETVPSPDLPEFDEFYGSTKGTYRTLMEREDPIEWASRDRPISPRAVFHTSHEETVAKTLAWLKGQSTGRLQGKWFCCWTQDEGKKARHLPNDPSSKWCGTCREEQCTECCQWDDIRLNIESVSESSDTDSDTALTQENFADWTSHDKTAEWYHYYLMDLAKQHREDRCRGRWFCCRYSRQDGDDIRHGAVNPRAVKCRPIGNAERKACGHEGPCASCCTWSQLQEHIKKGVGACCVDAKAAKAKSKISDLIFRSVGDELAAANPLKNDVLHI